MKKFAIILSGCGMYDGSETHETISLLLACSQQSVEVEAFAPDVDVPTYNHYTNEHQPKEVRSMLAQSAILMRGAVKPLHEMNVADYDAIVLPGGFGAVTHLCNWGTKGVEFEFLHGVGEKLQRAVELKKPMGFICIAPIMIAKLYQEAQLTLGKGEVSMAEGAATLAEQVSLLGSTHVDCAATDVVVDTAHKVVSTPANMVAKDISEVYQGIYKLVEVLSNM